MRYSKKKNRNRMCKQPLWQHCTIIFLRPWAAIKTSFEIFQNLKSVKKNCIDYKLQHPGPDEPIRNRNTYDEHKSAQCVIQPTFRRGLLTTMNAINLVTGNYSLGVGKIRHKNEPNPRNWCCNNATPRFRMWRHCSRWLTTKALNIE